MKIKMLLDIFWLLLLAAIMVHEFIRTKKEYIDIKLKILKLEDKCLQIESIKEDVMTLKKRFEPILIIDKHVTVKNGIWSDGSFSDEI